MCVFFFLYLSVNNYISFLEVNLLSSNFEIKREEYVKDIFHFVEDRNKTPD